MIPRELRTERLLLRQWRDGDAESLAAQLRFAIDEPAAAAAMGRRAQEHVRATYSLPAFRDRAAREEHGHSTQRPTQRPSRFHYGRGLADLAEVVDSPFDDVALRRDRGRGFG